MSEVETALSNKGRRFFARAQKKTETVAQLNCPDSKNSQVMM
jgi:hypothetical protein